VPPSKPEAWPLTGYPGERACEHGVGHGDHVHGCDGCCSRPDYPRVPKNPVEAVATFMEKSGHGKDTKSLYCALVWEEWHELMKAKTEVESLDAVIDLIWVLIGYGLTRGYDIEGAWNEVARTNLAKVAGKVKFRRDGKVQKPKGWKKPDLTKFV
jgi:Phosphoribosyl-ATP pyrophosphohydrolase